MDIYGFDDIDSAPYAWIITKDILAEEDNNDDMSDVGTIGPSNAPEELVALLKKGKGFTFRMYDDDGILYYKGKGIATDDAIGSEEFCYGPLGDFGMPNVGCVRIDWHGHKEWNCS